MSQCDAQLAWEMLCDLPDQLIERATTTLIQTKKDAYPNTNWIAELRTTAIAQRSIVDELTTHQRECLKALRGD